MYLFIFESIGTSELLLIGIIALIFLGPRKMPEMARKIGKIMADFRSTTNDFKATWEREVNFEEEARALRFDDEDEKPVARIAPIAAPGPAPGPEMPAIKEVDASAFDNLPSDTEADTAAGEDDDINDRKNWL